MTEDHFWQIIERTFEASDGQPEEQMAALAEELEKLSVEEVIAFDKRFEEFSRKAYTWDLWGAAFIIEGGCSDDAFIDFRSWLISRGREWYERVLEDADSLADYPADLQEDESPFFEEFAYIANGVCEDKSGDACEYDMPPYPSEPEGTPWDEEDEAALSKRWPKLFKKYWEG